jgi:hypothetical protein
MMRARLQVHVHSRASCLLAGLFEGDDFRVLYALVCVAALADEVPTRIDDNSADARIWRCKSDSLPR